MIICVCREISDTEIERAIESGLRFEQIVEKFECNQCRTCNFIIEEMCEDEIRSSEKS